ncbi:Putative E3 ubiquitin-protein ligase ARI4 [Cytospora mali]|uniref:RBR-type E3 ubiquitin transferase n=1 Tax=Cytospora mali TaxID=578113 RepID=A0A194UTY6_CYTMA|nr:Putative E3 ubiquitin-protein ligase ARI4 [Valsa mali var. pyri (nom. inval.)]
MRNPRHGQFHAHAHVPESRRPGVLPKNRKTQGQMIHLWMIFATDSKPAYIAGIGGNHPGSSHRVSSSSKRYYDTEVVSMEKPDRHHPPSASLRRSNTVSGSQAAASQHHSGFLLNVSIRTECVVCMDDIPSRKTAKLKCGHRMCHSCLKRSFKLSITDPQHMPPRCCTADNIPLKHVEKLFDNEFKKTWNKKFTEYSAKNRIYCIKRGCNEFIRPEDIHHADDGRKYGRCVRCRTKVCVKCNGKWHSARDCPKDEETVRFLAQAKDEGWQRCFRCKAMVELKEGCNHMTCRCGAEFCMICGERWKTCQCPWFNYDTVENDRLQHMQIPMPARDRFGGRPTVDVPPSPPRDWAPPGALPFSGSRPRPQNYDDEVLLRRFQEERDEAYARRLQNYQDYDDDREDDFLGGFGDINGIGNAGGHHLNEDYRPRPRHIAVPQPPQPPPMPAMPIDPAPTMFDRSGTGYVQDVNRARGVRANSLERRLADRFNTDLRQNPTHRGSTTHGPPPTLQSAATISLPPMTSAMASAAVPARRHTVEAGELYADESLRARSGGTRSVERVTASGRTTRPVVFDEPEEMMVPLGMVGRNKYIREPPKASNLAGLTGSGRGMDRVFEWRTHVAPGPGPDTASVTSSG